MVGKNIGFLHPIRVATSVALCLGRWIFFRQDGPHVTHMRTMVLEYESQHLPEQNHLVL